MAAYKNSDQEDPLPPAEPVSNSHLLELLREMSRTMDRHMERHPMVRHLEDCIISPEMRQQSGPGSPAETAFAPQVTDLLYL